MTPSQLTAKHQDLHQLCNRHMCTKKIGLFEITQHEAQFFGPKHFELTRFYHMASNFVLTPSESQ